MPIDRAVCWRLCSGERGKRRQEIQRCCHFMTSRSCRDYPGPPHYARLAHPAFVGRAFAATKWPCRSALLAACKPWAVVRCEDHERALVDLFGAQSIENFAHAPIKLRNGVTKR